MTRTHIFIDFENVRPSAEEFSLVPKADVVVWLLHGAHQNEFPAALVREWLRIGERVHLVQSTKTGENAVDMLLALSLGEARQQDLQAGRAARYLIVSKDKDFNALFAHVNREGQSLERIATLTLALERIRQNQKPESQNGLRASMTKEDVAATLKNLNANARNRPAKRNTLERNIHSLLGGQVTPAVTARVIDSLVQQGVIRFDGVKVVYVSR